MIANSNGAFISLALLWRELSGGLCRVVDSYFSDSQCVLVTTQNPLPLIQIDAQRLRILEGVLLSGGQKNLAIDMGLSASTVAGNARQALEQMGLRCKPSRAHPLLILAANAHRSGDLAVMGALHFVKQGERDLRIVSVARPDSVLAEVLPRAELAVAHCLVEGLCHVDIAARRGTSRRTVANQLSSVFRRLKVSGRGELLLRLSWHAAHALPSPVLQVDGVQVIQSHRTQLAADDSIENDARGMRVSLDAQHELSAGFLAFSMRSGRP